MSSKPITRRQWSEQHDTCMACGYTSRPWFLETHEIANGPARQAALKEPATWLRVCLDCHHGPNGLHNKGEWPVARQLALKLTCDPEHYDRVQVNLLRGRQPEAITEDEVDEWVKRMENACHVQQH